MKMPNIFRPKRSIAGRLTLRVTFTMLIVFAFTFALIIGFVWIVGFAMSIQIYEGFMGTSNEKVNNMLNSVEVAITNTVPAVERQLQDPDKMYSVVERILKLNPNITGSTIAFEPYYYKQKGLQFSPYAYREDSLIKTKQLGTDQYKYHSMEWYAKPKEERKACWTNPYFDEGGGNIAMTTYSLPLFDDEGKMYAVITADLSLEWIAELTYQMDSIINNSDLLIRGDSAAHSYSFIIGNDGKYIAHPDKELILKETIKSHSEKTSSPLDDKLASNMTEAKSGSQIIMKNDSLFLTFYRPLERTGWSMGTAVPLTELFEFFNYFIIFLLILMFIGLLVVIFICQRTINVVTKPLTKFADSADEIANGNFEADLPFIKTKDEMRRLYDSFETMQHSLVSQIEETMKVNAQKGRIESELHIASGIQQTMIPKTFPAYPERDDMDIFALLTPAKEVGGDLYDFYIRDEKLFFCIGDVSGKGVPASLVMAVIRSLFRSVTAHESNATRIMTLINEGMSDMNESGMFVTLFVGVLDLPTGRLRYCNAGHCPPIIIGAEVMPLPIISNIPCGIMQSFKFQGQETMMIPGDTLFLYTDGLTEAEDLHHELFGDKRPLEVAGKTDALPYNIITAMADAVHAFAGNAEQSDDLTMLAIQYKRIQQEARLKRSLTLPNDISSIPQLNAFIEEAAEEMGLDPSVTMELNLAIEEAVVNVMDYAYPAGKKGTVEIGLSANEERLKITIKDSGVPFDPTVKDDVDTTLSAEERPIGGLGIFLVRQLMDSINYERINGQNILTLRKKLGEKK